MKRCLLQAVISGFCVLFFFSGAVSIHAEGGVSTGPARFDSQTKDDSMSAETLPPVPGTASPSLAIREMTVPHCKRGPQRCTKCRENTQTRFCLLDINPPHQGMVQRPVLELTISGTRVFREYDVVKTFKTPEEAREYAKQQHIPILSEP